MSRTKKESIESEEKKAECRKRGKGKQGEQLGNVVCGVNMACDIRFC